MSEYRNGWHELARRLKAVRKGRGLTQRELAQRIGRSPPRISELESGTSDPRISTVLDLVAALGLKLVAVSNAQAHLLSRRRAEEQGHPSQLLTVFEELVVPDPDDTDLDDDNDDDRDD